MNVVTAGHSFCLPKKAGCTHKHDRSRSQGMKKSTVKENQTRLYSFFK